jgi:hypothetical protein
LCFEPVRSPCTIPVGDSVESDGRFVLRNQQRKYWQSLAGAAADERYNSSKSSNKTLKAKANRKSTVFLTLTERLIANALKKMGCDAATHYLRSLQQITAQSQSIAGGQGGGSATHLQH